MLDTKPHPSDLLEQPTTVTRPGTGAVADATADAAPAYGATTAPRWTTRRLLTVPGLTRARLERA